MDITLLLSKLEAMINMPGLVLKLIMFMA